MRKATISAIEHYLPANKVSNSFFLDKSGVSEHSIIEKTGVSTRHYLDEGATSDLVVPAIKKLLYQRKISIDEIDCLIVATVTPDYQFPSTAAVVLNKLNACRCYGYDISAACAGFVYALSQATAFIELERHKRVLVCGADKMSSTLNFNDYKTSILFGDGAGVVLVEASTNEDSIIHETICRLDTSGLTDVYIPFGGTANQLNPSSLELGYNKMQMKGKKVFEAGVASMSRVILEFLRDNNMSLNEIDFIIPHQANKNMLLRVAESLQVSQDKILINIETVGNTSAASIPICLSEFYKNETLHEGHNILLCGFGAGYTYGLTYLTL